MKILTVDFLQRFNLGNYEHVEVKLSAGLDEGEDAVEAIGKLKVLVGQGVFQVGKPHDPVEAPKADVAQDTRKEEPKKEEPKKPAPKKEAKKEEPKKEEEPSKEAVLVKEDKKEDGKVTKYSTAIEEHKKIFASHLAKTFGDTWKTKPGLKEFSASLNGVIFLDTKGQIADSFKARVNEFFGASEGVL